MEQSFSAYYLLALKNRDLNERSKFEKLFLDNIQMSKQIGALTNEVASLKHLLALDKLQ